MNIKEYIESGILELYLTGALSEQEAVEVESNLLQYPELQEELDAIQQALQQVGKAASPALSDDLFSKIESKIDNHPSPPAPGESSSSKKFGGGKWLGLIGLAGIAFGAYSYGAKIKADNELSSTKSELNNLQVLLNECEKNKEEQETLFALKSSAKNAIILAGQAASPESYAIVHWNPESKKLIVDASGMPAPPDGKVYQLWSLKMNPLTPSDAGLLNNFTETTSLLFEMNDVESAEGFAITLEDAGGSEVPTLEQLYVLGTI